MRAPYQPHVCYGETAASHVRKVYLSLSRPLCKLARLFCDVQDGLLVGALDYRHYNPVRRVDGNPNIKIFLQHHVFFPVFFLQCGIQIGIFLEAFYHGLYYERDIGEFYPLFLGVLFMTLSHLYEMGHVGVVVMGDQRGAGRCLCHLPGHSLSHPLEGDSCNVAIHIVLLYLFYRGFFFLFCFRGSFRGRRNGGLCGRILHVPGGDPSVPARAFDMRYVHTQFPGQSPDRGGGQRLPGGRSRRFCGLPCGRLGLLLLFFGFGGLFKNTYDAVRVRRLSHGLCHDLPLLSYSNQRITNRDGLTRLIMYLQYYPFPGRGYRHNGLIRLYLDQVLVQLYHVAFPDLPLHHYPFCYTFSDIRELEVVCHVLTL